MAVDDAFQAARTRLVDADRIRVRLLGSLEMSVDGEPVELGPPKQRALFAILVLHRGETVSTDRIIDLLWAARAPRTAGHSVQIYVSELRRTFAAACGDPLIETRRPGYRIEIAEQQVDAAAFERLVERGHVAALAGDHAAVSLLEEALRLWTGEPLGDFAFEEFAASHVRRLSQLHVSALEDLAAALLGSGRPVDAVSVAEQGASLEPLRERLCELRMTALYRAGRHPDALSSYRRFREQLAEELGVDPSPVLQRLHEQILLHDPGLLPAGDVTSIREPGQNPFKGLRPFTEQDADDFFGRERLVTQIIERLQDGSRLVAVVGPSGSGKSSLVQAGVVPCIRGLADVTSDRDAVAVLPPGRYTAQDLSLVVSQAAAGGPGAARPTPVAPYHRVVLVMDQFEEYFLAEEGERDPDFLEELLRLMRDPEGSVSVLLTLRADLFDRPLQDARFAPAFTSGVVTVLPMTAEELQAAIVTPARRAGMSVEASLLARLVADSVGLPAPLPLLQYTLTELFERARDGSLRLADYQALGGLQAALSERAERFRHSWSESERQAATQLLLRLVRCADGDRVVRRRVPVAELADLTRLDPTAVSDVLLGLSRDRLATFDRDAISGAATVEVAHDALIAEWRWLADLVERHRSALRRRDALVAAMDEWDAADRSPEYLLRGARLAEAEGWRREGVLALTAREVAFVEQSSDREREEHDLLRRQREERRRLERRARRRLALLALSGVALAATGGAAILARPEPPPKVAWVSHGGFVANLTEAGIERAGATTDISVVDVEPEVLHVPAELERLADSDVDLMVLGVLDADVAAVARRHPDKHFVDLIGAREAPNVTVVGFADQEGSFLAGAAAALASKTGVVAFLGGVNTPLVRRIEAGFVAGARAARPSVEVRVRYITEVPDYRGFVEPRLAAAAARALIGDDVDVLFPASGETQFGAFQAAIDRSTRIGRHIWVIGVDDDAHRNESWQNSPSWRRHVLTSMVKRFDLAAYEAVVDYVRGRLSAEPRVYDISNGGVVLAESGGFLAPFEAMLDNLRNQITEGSIVAPCVPKGLRGQAAADAAMGLKCPKLHSR